MAEENPFARLFDKPASSVQLAVLQPGLPEAPIHITLTNAEPGTTSYDCISYDRSQDHGNVEVNVDGLPLPVTKPLESALRSLRRTDQPRNLWADVLVGSNTEERSTQAAVMKTVLENAESTIAWLGPGDEQTVAAFDVLQTMANRWQQACLHSGFPERMAQATQQQMTGLFQHIMSKPTAELQPSNAALWKSLEAVFESSYFESVQTIPELMLAKKAIIVAGSSSMSWPDFIAAGRAGLIIMAQQLSKTVSERHKKVFELVGSLEIAARRRREGETLELLPMIQSSRDCSTSDPREIVFSMLPIVTPSARTAGSSTKQSPPIVDYAKSTQDVFTEAAKYVIHERQDLLLWWTERPPRGRQIKGLPTWVPDWSSPLPKHTVKIMPTKENGMRVWWEHIHPKAKRISVDDSNALHVQAHALDRIISVSPIFTHENCRRLCLTEWQALRTLPGESNDAKVQKMFRTLVLNQASFGFGETAGAAPPPHRDMWVSFQSVMAEERILELLGCTQEQLQTQPELLARAREIPDAVVLGPQTGRSAEFEALLRANAIGRRFFQTQSGRIGMTAVESLPEGAGAAAEAEQEPQVPSFEDAMANPMGQMMLSGFQDFLRQRDPQAAGMLSQALNGSLPGQAAPGVRRGDHIVALVGGFQPYVLRPAGEYDATQTAEQSLDSVSRYTYVGDCYLHGVMDGEPFKTKGWFETSWTREVKLVDVTIV
ncbi:hypothetical protein LTR36_000980 [Oleoguttula mirabilis]|uniref:Heterokaryon incompatibility domain-containing protein n=1 Tax=Oleoguttula mirabilis TaxID=1507867 RepID=A0AAV9JPI1_9PEZI|nr:hypothetical protein LTR36_000980 [Oleoguttula mirabilis]